MVSGITAAIVVSALFFGLCFVFLYDCWVLMFSGFIGESMAQAIDATGSFCSATANWCHSAIAAPRTHCSVVLYAARTMHFPRLFIRVRNFAHISFLSKLYFVCKCVHAAHTIEIYTPTHFSPLPKKCQIKTDFLSIQTRTNKRLAGFSRYIVSYRFLFFFAHSLFVVIMLCNTFAMGVCECAYVLCDLRTRFASFSHERIKMYFMYWTLANTLQTVYSRS